MKRQRFELALERLRPSDWERFETISSVFLAADFPNLRTVASPSGDQGRDAILFSPRENPTVLLQYSVTTSWDDKIRKTVRRISEGFPKTTVLIYVSNQLIGARADALIRELLRDKSLYLDIRDRNWFLERFQENAQREMAAEALAAEIVDPYLASKEVVESKAQALSTLESRAALLYLNLQWEDDTREKGLTKLSFEALVRAALRDTDPEHRLSRSQVHTKVRAFLPTHASAQVDAYTDPALARLTKKSVRYYTASDEFCLTYDERLRLKDRFTVLERQDIALQEELRELTRQWLILFEVLDESLLDEVAVRIRRVLEQFLLCRGELFASAVKTGHFRHLGDDGLREIVIQEISLHPAPPGIKGEFVEILMKVVSEILLGPGAATQSYLRTLADSYTLFAFLSETPDVQSAVAKMFSHGEVWLDTTVLLPVFAEVLSEIENKQFTNMLRAANESGLGLRITKGVLIEIERHMNYSLACARHTAATWKGRIPFLYSICIQSGQAPSEFPKWLEQFMGAARPMDDIAEYLEREFEIQVSSLEAEAATASLELRSAVQEEWIAARERRRRQYSADVDPATALRLVEHDLENYLGIIGRRHAERVSPFGYTSWWLTLDHRAFEVESNLSSRLKGKKPDSPVMSADFLINYLSFGPIRARVSKTTESSLPIILATGTAESFPNELLELAEKVREDARDLPASLISRRVRDALDVAKRRMGRMVRGGLEDAGRVMRDSITKKEE